MLKGSAVELILHLYEGADDTSSNANNLESVVTWGFIVSDDYNSATPPLVVADNSDISITTDETGVVTVHIPITKINSVELNAALGTSAQLQNLIAELTGYDKDGDAVYSLQLEGLTIRNRIQDTGVPPQNTEANYLDAEQVRALIASGVVMQFSVDGADWHDAQTTDDKYIRVRSASSINSVWSDAVLLATGPQGPQGIQGPTPSITVGTVTTVEAGQQASASITQTNEVVTLNLAIPKGDTGSIATIEPGTATSLAPDSAPTIDIVNNAEGTGYILNLGIPKGYDGQQGPVGPTGLTGPIGPAPTVTIGTVTSLAAGSEATAEITQSGNEVVLSLGIPKGYDGQQGPTGPAINVSVGSVTTLEPGSNATVTREQTDNEVVLHFGLPRGADGNIAAVEDRVAALEKELTGAKDLLDGILGNQGSN
jgi:hypothetical protein